MRPGHSKNCACTGMKVEFSTVQRALRVIACVFVLHFETGHDRLKFANACSKMQERISVASNIEVS